MKLTNALNSFGGIVGRSKFRTVSVELVSFGKKGSSKEEIKSTWTVYVEGSGHHTGSTFREAVDEYKRCTRKKRIKRFQDVKHG